MKYLLTSADVRNTSIHNAIVDLLGKPVAEANALYIPTAGYGPQTSNRPGHGGSSVDKHPKRPCASWGGMGLGNV